MSKIDLLKALEEVVREAMTNYNEKLDETLHDFAVSESLSETHLSDKLKRKVITADEYDDRLVQNYRENKAQAKQAITSLTKELVAEAKPNRSETQQGSVTVYGDLNERDLSIINQFEQNLLKGLEEV